MQDLTGKKIVLGVCGGIAAYKSAYLLRELLSLGADVRVVMTASAAEFIAPMTFQALSGEPVRNTLFDAQAERAMGHIELARWADYLLIAPASANCLAKMAQGLADDLLSTLYLVAETPVIVCPAMNRSMWAHPATQANCQILQQRGVLFVGPEEGSQACGEYGLGRLSDTDLIINALRLFSVQNLLQGQRVLITAGPTREAIDPVRFISNHSSGKMGYALAEAAYYAGADVTLISGPCDLPLPYGIHRVQVETAQEMLDSVMAQLQPGQIFIAAAAVADYAVKTPAAGKIKKTTADTLHVELTKNPDILGTVARTKTCRLCVGFAAETENLLDNARDKLKRKGLDMVIANQVGDGLAFHQDDNEVMVVTDQEATQLPRDHKHQLAAKIIAIIAARLQNTGSK